MNRDKAYGVMIALLCALVFFAWSFADAIDQLGQPDRWERAAADRHADVLRAMCREVR